MSEFSCNQITQNIYIGNILSPINENYLNNNNIGYIINLSGLTYNKINHIMYLDIPISDVPNTNISSFFELTNEFINTCIAHNKSILVHCYAGISRSATIVLAYLISKGMKLENAYQMVKMKRNIINPNSGFMRQLQDYDNRINRNNKMNNRMNNKVMNNPMNNKMNNRMNNNMMNNQNGGKRMCNYCFIDNQMKNNICENCFRKIE